MRHVARSFSLAVLLLVLAAGTAWAQATGAIAGTIRDESGAVLPGVTITATHTGTGVTRTTASNETGSYSLPNLPLGPYRLEAALDGFKTSVQTGITVQVNSNLVVNPVLGVGAIAEQITVTASANMVETRQLGVSTVVESQRIVALPLNSRDVTQLITLSGLAVQTGGNGPGGMKTGVTISVAGSTTGGVSYSLDGAPHLNTFDGTGLNLPFPDALQEFRIVTSSQEASSGVRPGASVNAVTKAGSNDFRGGLFEFMRDKSLNAPDFTTGRDDGLKRHQFGGTIGGPIVKNRVFFFAGYQGTTTRQTPGDTTAFVPTAAMRAGDFTAFASPACNNGAQLTLRGGFVNNRINPALLSPAALEVSARLPAAIDACGKTLFGVPVHENEGQIPLRLDFQASQNHSFVVRYMLTTDYRQVPYDQDGTNNILLSSTSGSDDRAHSITFGHSWVINSKAVNSFRVLANDVYAIKPGPKYFSPSDVGIKAYTGVPGYTRIIVNNGFSVGSGSFTSNLDTKVKSYGASDDFTLVKGSHQLSVGGHYLYGLSHQVAQAWSPGSYQFTTQFTGNALADFMTGKVAQHRQGSENPVHVSQPFIAAYAQDTWTFGRATASYGLVWNPYMPLTFVDGDVYNFSRDKALAGVRSTVYPGAPAGFSYPGDPGFNGTSGVNAHFNTWEPRGGLAYSLTEDGRTVVRVGAGIAHDYVNHSSYLNESNSSPFRLTVNLPAGVSLDDPWTSYAGGNPFPYTFDPKNPKFPANSSFLPLPPDLPATAQYSWNAGVQRQFSPRLFASATYVGTKIDHLVGAEEQNPALFVPGNCVAGQFGLTAAGPCSTAANINFRRALNLKTPDVISSGYNPSGPNLAYITQYTGVAYQNYNGLLLNARIDRGRDLNFNLNYTLSKCQGVAPAGLLNTGASHIHQPFQNNGSQDITLDEGPCVQDRRHVFNLTAVIRTPNFSNRVAQALAGDWTVASVIQARSGTPVNVTAGSDVALNGFTDNAPTQRPNLVAGVDPYGTCTDAGPGVRLGCLNAAAFSQPATGTYGDVTPFLLGGPAFWQWDQSFTRSFGLGSGHRFEIRAEAINLANHLNWGLPGASLGSLATFGRETPIANGQRIWQLAAKYDF